MTCFKGTISGEDLRSILKAATVLVEDCRVFFNDGSLKIRGTDEAGVSMVVIEVSKGAFIECTIEEEDACWNFEEMTDMIKMADSDTEISLELQDHDLQISFIDLQYSLSLLNPEILEKDEEKPEMDLNEEIILDSSAFKRGVTASELVADHVEFGIDEGKSAFYMEAKGDVNEVILERKKQDLVTLSAEPASSTYSVDYLKNICSAIPDDTEVGISLGTDLPTEISYEIIEGKVTVTYFIAPRLQPES